MQDPSRNVDGGDAAAELVVVVPEDWLVLAAECGVGRRIERRFDLVKPVVQPEAWVRVRMWSRFWVWVK